MLFSKIDAARPGLVRAQNQVWSAPDITKSYVGVLAAMHQITRASAPLMAAAADECSRIDDTVAELLEPYYRKHVKEETGHDDWAKEDLRAVGADADAIVSAMPSTAVAELVGAQYYWLHHHHPVTLMGYIAVLEGYPPSIEGVEKLEALTGLHESAFRTMRRHAVLDPRHRADIVRTIDELPLSGPHTTALGISALHTVRSLASVFAQVAAGEWGLAGGSQKRRGATSTALPELMKGGA